MNRKAYASILALVFLSLAFLTGCSSSSSTPPPPVESIAATSGTPQSAPVNTAFAAPLSATVTTGGSPVSGVTVTFTAPASGASGTFANGTNTDTETTNTSGVATSTTFTANATASGYTVTASASGVSTPASFSLTNTARAAASITATSGTPQSAKIDTAFAAPLVATVLDSGQNPVSGVVVTFAAPPSGASGTFANGTTTDTESTNASGVATSTTFTANGTAGGPYTVAATVAGVSTEADFSLTNKTAVASSNYSFYLSGLEAVNSGPNFYALAGSVSIDSNGNVLVGEQDYNDAFGLTSPQPSGDTITGGTLTVDPTTGQGTLTLITNNTALGVNGTETLGVQFVNTNHALIVQFDGTATSSGSMDLQTLPSTLSGGYAFTLSGVNPDYYSVVAGGVLSISGTTLQNGRVDVDDFETGITLGTAFSGTISAPDAFGRGTITGTGIAVTINYYIVGPEAIRIIDVDDLDSAVGSAFGQGAGAFSNASLGSSVFGIESNSYGILYAAAGQFATDGNGNLTRGVADDDEEGFVFSGVPISGTYSIASNGYGSLTITAGDLGHVSTLGIYMTDPNLNLNDPNNTTSGSGGALVADLDSFLVNGTGVLIPQTDTSTASFAGNYAFGAQDYNGLGSSWEFDFVGQGSVTGGVLTETGLVSDPFSFFSANATDSGVTFSGPAAPDGGNAGRYTMFTPNPLVITAVPGSPIDFSVVIYQASGGQLFWLDEDSDSLFLGSLQQQGSLNGLPAATRAAAKTKPKQKR